MWKKFPHISDKYADRHFRSQSAQLYDRNGQALFDFHLQLEDLSNQWLEPDILKAYPAPTFVNVNKERNIEEFYKNQRIVELVEQRYRSDIVNFGYTLC